MSRQVNGQTTCLLFLLINLYIFRKELKNEVLKKVTFIQ